MGYKPSAKVVLNRANLTELGLALADGVEEICKTVVEVATPNAPDSPYDPYPTGEGLPKQGGWLVYQGANKVGGGSTRGLQPKKPRALVVRGTTAIVGIAGFGFPGRFAETGTAKTPAQPFLTPAALQVAGVAGQIMASAVAPRLRAKR